MKTHWPQIESNSSATDGHDPALLGEQFSIQDQACSALFQCFFQTQVKIFAEDRPAQYSLRYRLDDGTFLRGTTDLDGNNGVALQYELRF